MPKQKSGGGKSTISNDNHDENVGQRGEAIKQGGNKIHGDHLEGAIPDRDIAGNRFPEKPMAGNRPNREDGDNDDLGELDEPGTKAPR